MSETEPVKDAAIGISVQCATGESQIVFQTFIAKEAPQSDLDALLDRLTKAAARQRAKIELVELQKRLKIETSTLERMCEDRKRVEASLAPQEGRRNTSGKSEADLKRHREQADATEKRMLEILGDIRQEIEATKALIAGN